MKLKTTERFNLLNILPKEGNFSTLKIIRHLKESLSLSEEENKNWNVRELPRADGKINLQWNKDGQKANVEIRIGEKAMDIIVAQLKRLNASSSLPDYLFDIYERFVEKKKGQIVKLHVK